MSHRCALGVIAVRQPLLGGFTSIQNFLHLWILALTAVEWSPEETAVIFFTVFNLLYFDRKACFKGFLNSAGLAVFRPGSGSLN